MKGWHLLTLFVVILGVVTGTLMARDPGYVLISYNGSSMQTSLWVFLFILIVLAVLFYFIARSTEFLTRSSENFRRWRTQQKKDKASDSTLQGLVLLESGKFEQAEKLLLKGSVAVQNHVLNYIAAARAANFRGDDEKKNQYLKQAQKLSGKDNQLVNITRARMAYERNDYKSCIRHLKDTEKNRLTLSLLKDACFKAGDHKTLSSYMRDFMRVFKDNRLLSDLQKYIFLGILESGTSDAKIEEAKKEYHKLIKAVRSDPQIMRAYIRFMIQAAEEEEAEKAIREHMGGHMDDELLAMYGKLGNKTLKPRLKQSRKWLASHPENTSVLNCTGSILYSMGNLEDARQVFMDSYKINATPCAAKHLGIIYAEQGNLSESNRFFRAAGF